MRRLRPSTFWNAARARGRALGRRIAGAADESRRRLRARLEARFADWSPDGPVPGGPSPARRSPAGPTRVGYYLWRFPLLSETFIRREMAALVEAGVPVAVVADERDDARTPDRATATMLPYAAYVLPVSYPALLAQAAGFLARRPLTFLRLALFVAVTRYDRDKSLAADARLFGKAIAVAARMRALGVGHVHSPWANANALVALVASRLLGVGFSVQARAHDLHRDDTAFALPTKFRHARFVVTNTRYNEAGVRALLPEPERAKVHRIHNGIDLAEFVPLRVPNDDGVPRILSVARLIEPKGLTLLLRACAALRDRGVAFRCDVIGGPEEPLYTAYRVQLGVLHRQLGLAEQVRFRGALPIAEVLDAYRGADLFVLPCVEAANGSKDITPNALIEAMAMGLPVISTRMTGIPEIVDDGCSGVLVAPGDVDALTDALARLLDDAPLRARLGAEARRAVQARFDIRTNVREYVRLFRDAC